MKKLIIFVSILLVISIGILVALLYKNSDVLLSNENVSEEKNIIEEKPKEPTKEEKYLALGQETLETLTLDEKIGQLLLVR